MLLDISKVALREFINIFLHLQQQLVCIHLHVYVCMQVHLCEYICIYICINIFVCVCISMYPSMYIFFVHLQRCVYM